MQQALTGAAQEAEHKYMLTEGEYSRIIGALVTTAHLTTQKTHTNYYFDTEEFKLYHRNETLRIREYDNAYTATYKAAPSAASTGNFLVRSEYEYLLDSCTAEKIIANDDGALKLLTDLPGLNESFKCMGRSVTERTEFHIFSSPILLDKTIYLGTADYELEYELAGKNDNADQLKAWLKQHKISYSSIAVSKSKRFLKGCLISII